MKKKVFKILKIVGIALLAIFVLLIVLILSLRLPAVQNQVKNYMVNYLEDKIKTDVSLDKVYVDFPSSIVLENLYLQGQKKDALLYAHQLDVGLDIPKLLDNTVDLTSIDMENVRANVVRDKNGRFNFDYIIEAFATKETETTESKPWVISLDKIHLKNIGVNFTDLQQKNDLQVYFNEFKTTVDKFDLDQNHYALDKIILDGLNLEMQQDLFEEVATEVKQDVDSLNAQKPMQLGLNQIELTNIKIDYADDNTQTYGKIDFGELNSKINQLDLQKQLYDVENVNFANADLKIDLHLPATNAEEVEVEAEATQSTGLSVLLNQFKFNNVKVEYNNTAISRQSSGMDFNHLDFEKLDIEVQDFEMKNGTFAGIIESAKIQEKGHLNVLELTTKFKYGEQQAYLKDLLLKTDQSLLQDEVVLSYTDMNQLTSNPNLVELSANIQNSKIGFQDILNFMPSLKNTAPFNQYPNAVLNLDAKANGTLDDIYIQQLNANGIGHLNLIANGNIKNATDVDNLFYELNIQKLSASAKTIKSLAPANTIPSNISLPNQMLLTGTAKGTTEIIDADLKLKSSDGNADVLAHVNMAQKNAETYDIKADVDDLNIGKIIQNKDLGKVSGKINVKGKSFDFEKGTANITGDIQYIDYNQYRYNHLTLKGSLEQGYYDVNLDSKDQNANLTMRANGLLNQKNPTIQMAGNIRKLDLQKLNFYNDALILAGNINGEFSNLNPDELNGEFTLTNFAISDSKDVYPLQEVHFKAVSNAEGNSLTLNSQLIDAKLTGNYKLTQIFESLTNTINSYYQIQKPSKASVIVQNQYIDFDVRIKNDDVIRKFVPDLKSFETITLVGNYNADSKQLYVDGKIPKLTYAGNHIENGLIEINTENQSLNYNVDVGVINNESFKLNHIKAVGGIANNVIDFNITTEDFEGTQQYLIAGNVESFNDLHQISLEPNGLKLNDENWQVAENNVLKISNSGGLYAENFKISNGQSSIQLQSSGSTLNSPLNVDIKDFDIATITEIVKKDELPASGLINGSVALNNLATNMTFTSDLTITKLTVYEQLVGTIDAQVNSKNADLLDINVQLSDNDNDVKITGDYNIAKNGLNLLVDANKLQMKSLEGFAMNEIKETEGDLSGELKITGTTSNPQILGTLALNNVGFKISQTGSDFRNINDKIYFRNEGIVFDNFKVNDNSGNTLLVDGKILTETYTDFAFNLDVNAKDFKVVDSEENRDQMMYGILAINADLQIGGDLDLPVVNGAIDVADNTDFTFVVPQTSPTLEERNGIVRFVDKDLESLKGTIKQDTITTESTVKGLDVNVGISITEEALVSLIIDKATGDFVKLRGNAELSGGIDPSGKTTLVGVYEVIDGAYELNISMVNRRFDIQKGSVINWNGNPLEATLDMTAVYNIKAAPIDLLQQQLSGLAPSEYNMYKQRIPFKTLLKMNGDLMKPIITFDITLEDENPSVAASVIDNTKVKLQQIRQDESEMNKQVFALLLLNRFIGENPFSSESGMSAGTMTRQSVSQILSQQLNNLASDLIAGVNLDFNFDSYDDYSQGQKNTRTDLNVGLSKRLLNDRLKITVGSKFGLEGAARENEELTNIAGDVKIDYMLSKNGRYMLRAFRTNEYEVALQGQIIETGVGFIITLEYDKFKDIFKKSKAEKEND